jgi:RHS repeat-associated protein
MRSFTIRSATNCQYAGDQTIENVTTKRFFFQDSLGNTSHLSDEAGNLLERYTYSAFGLPTFYTPGGTVTLGNVSTKGTRHLFQGQLWTQETGLNDYRNRMELPTMGVFLQPDPIGFKGDAANLYRFCSNNAVNQTDPMGLFNPNAGAGLTSWANGGWFADGGMVDNQTLKMAYDDATRTAAGPNGGGGGNDNGKFYKGVDQFTSQRRSDVSRVSPAEIGREVVADAREAAEQTDDTKHLGRGAKSGQERAYAGYVKGSSLVRSGPKTGKAYNSGHETHIPGPPKGLPSDAFPLTVSHSHGPGSGRSFQGRDIPSANGSDGRPYISSVGYYGDRGAHVIIYVPGAGTFHSRDGVSFFSGPGL